MGELVRLVMEVITTLWPLRVVKEWEQGGYYVGGRFWRMVGPGVKPVVPWFCEVVCVSMVPAIVGTGRQEITLTDGSTLTFIATAWVRVTDAAKALNEVDDYQETSQELFASVMADRLASVDATRLSPAGRKRLAGDLSRWVQEEAGQYGLEFSDVRFTSFVQNVRTYRLLSDGTPMGW